MCVYVCCVCACAHACVYVCVCFCVFVRADGSLPSSGGMAGMTAAVAAARAGLGDQRAARPNYFQLASIQPPQYPLRLEGSNQA